jgi:hypothetical protein
MSQVFAASKNCIDPTGATQERLAKRGDSVAYFIWSAPLLNRQTRESAELN